MQKNTQSKTTYLSLARKYRPQIMSDLIGQDFLVETLNNSFSLNRIASAFILTGIRGVGKTTTARIIAKALNCVGEHGSGDPTLSPCGVCNNCTAILQDNHIDVIEMDAASKTGVDDIREIIESAKYKPVSARYKIFIIDEVHMLSKNAFNALLKTLEEPPAHLKFIFATTEIKKVPITVLSRCQRFDLKRITTIDLQNHLENICKKENVSYNKEALFLLARSSSGSVRDSLSLLDQAIVYTNKNIIEDSIIQMLGKGNQEEIYNLFLYIIQKDIQQTFELLNQQYEKGIDINVLFESLLEICHNVSVITITHDINLLSLPENEINKATEISKLTNTATLIKLWQIILKGIQEIKEFDNSILISNMIINKMLFVNDLGNLSVILEKLKNRNSQNNNIKEEKERSFTNINDTNHNNLLKNNIISREEEIKKEVLDHFPNSIFKGKEKK